MYVCKYHGHSAVPSPFQWQVPLLDCGWVMPFVFVQMLLSRQAYLDTGVENDNLLDTPQDVYSVFVSTALI